MPSAPAADAALQPAVAKVPTATAVDAADAAPAAAGDDPRTSQRFTINTADAKSSATILSLLARVRTVLCTGSRPHAEFEFRVKNE